MKTLKFVLLLIAVSSLSGFSNAGEPRVDLQIRYFDRASMGDQRIGSFHKIRAGDTIRIDNRVGPFIREDLLLEFRFDQNTEYSAIGMEKLELLYRGNVVALISCIGQLFCQIGTAGHTRASATGILGLMESSWVYDADLLRIHYLGGPVIDVPFQIEFRNFETLEHLR